MPDTKPDLSSVRTFMSWALYGLTATIATVSSVAYMDMKKQRNDCQKENNYYARTAFDNAMKSRAQEQIIKMQDTVITEAKAYIQDTIKPVNVKNFEGKLNIKKNKQ